MQDNLKKIWDYYAMTPNAPIYQREFGYYVLDRWIREGYLKPRNAVSDYDAYLREVFDFDAPAIYTISGLGSCEGSFLPEFEEKVLEDRGEYELVQDTVGRGVLYFKNRRDGFMPEYVTHPVTDQKSWEENVKWRLDPHTQGRTELTRESVNAAAIAQEKGCCVVQNVVGGYMFLRSLMGPVDLMYMFYDDPELIHDCMRTWFHLADHVIAEHQKAVSFDELFLDEDICYKSGPLISEDMIKEFLLPYYDQLRENTVRRNKNRKLHFQIETDGNCLGILPLYRAHGVDCMGPFEVAAGCDVVEVAQKYPDLHICGGIDKRLIAKGGDDIRRHLEYVLPPLRARGGYLPSCDHGVPEETSFENYMDFRQLLSEYCN